MPHVRCWQLAAREKKSQVRSPLTARNKYFRLERASRRKGKARNMRGKNMERKYMDWAHLALLTPLPNLFIDQGPKFYGFWFMHELEDKFYYLLLKKSFTLARLIIISVSLIIWHKKWTIKYPLQWEAMMTWQLWEIRISNLWFKSHLNSLGVSIWAVTGSCI